MGLNSCNSITQWHFSLHVHCIILKGEGQFENSPSLWIFEYHSVLEAERRVKEGHITSPGLYTPIRSRLSPPLYTVQHSVQLMPNDTTVWAWARTSLLDTVPISLWSYEAPVCIDFRLIQCSADVKQWASWVMSHITLVVSQCTAWIASHFLSRIHDKWDKTKEVNADLWAAVRFEVFTAVTMKNGVFWDVTLCGSCKNRRCGGT
jgi:hypothetical protein